MREGESKKHSGGSGALLPRVGAWAIAVAGGLFLGSSSVSVAGLVVAQVESPAESGMFSPVNFERARTRVISDGAFAGLSFAADSGTVVSGNDASGHASMVGEQFYGVGSPGHDYVSQVRVLKTDDFLGQYLRPTSRGKVLKAPKTLPGKPKVLNGSFAGSSGSDALDADLLKRVDVLGSRDGVVIVAGAVTSTSGSMAGANLIWGARNVLSVRGSASESVFVPAAGLTGKAYVNVWLPGTASNATGAVSSMATALLGELSNSGNGKIAKPAVARAAIMAGADRAASISGDQPWSADLSNGLDRDLGAGQASFTNAQSLIRGSQLDFVATSMKKGQLSGKKARTIHDEAGFAGVTVKASQYVTSLFRVSEAADSLTATLTWDTSAKSGQTGDFRVELRPVTITGTGGAAWVTGDALAVVDATTDNVRHMVLEQEIPAGTYAWVLRNESKESFFAGFAYHVDSGADAGLATITVPAFQNLPGSIAVPEVGVGGGALCAGMVVGLMRRRR